jgi:hypothetical protein
MVSLLTLGLILAYNAVEPRAESSTVPPRVIAVIVAACCTAAIAWAIWQSKQEREDLNGEMQEVSLAKTEAAQK